MTKVLSFLTNGLITSFRTIVGIKHDGATSSQTADGKLATFVFAFVEK